MAVPKSPSDTWDDGDLVAPPSVGSSPIIHSQYAASAADAISDGKGEEEDAVGAAHGTDPELESSSVVEEFYDEMDKFDSFQKTYGQLINEGFSLGDPKTKAEDDTSSVDFIKMMEDLRMDSQLSDASVHFTVEFWGDDDAEGKTSGKFVLRAGPREIPKKFVSASLSGEAGQPLHVSTTYRYDEDEVEETDASSDEEEHADVDSVFNDTPAPAPASAAAAAAAEAAVVIEDPPSGGDEVIEDDVKWKIPRKGRCSVIVTLSDRTFDIHVGLFTERYDLDTQLTQETLRADGRYAESAHKAGQVSLAGRKNRQFLWAEDLVRPKKRTRSGKSHIDDDIQASAVVPDVRPKNTWTNVTNTDLVRVEWNTDGTENNLLDVVHLHIPMHLPHLQEVLQAAWETAQVVR